MGKESGKGQKGPDACIQFAGQYSCLTMPCA